MHIEAVGQRARVLVHRIFQHLEGVDDQVVLGVHVEVGGDQEGVDTLLRTIGTHVTDQRTVLIRTHGFTGRQEAHLDKDLIIVQILEALAGGEHAGHHVAFRHAVHLVTLDRDREGHGHVLTDKALGIDAGVLEVVRTMLKHRTGHVQHVVERAVQIGGIVQTTRTHIHLRGQQRIDHRLGDDGEYAVGGLVDRVRGDRDAIAVVLDRIQLGQVLHGLSQRQHRRASAGDGGAIARIGQQTRGQHLTVGDVVHVGHHVKAHVRQTRADVDVGDRHVGLAQRVGDHSSAQRLEGHRILTTRHGLIVEDRQRGQFAQRLGVRQLTGVSVAGILELGLELIDGVVGHDHLHRTVGRVDVNAQLVGQLSGGLVDGRHRHRQDLIHHLQLHRRHTHVVGLIGVGGLDLLPAAVGIGVIRTGIVELIAEGELLDRTLGQVQRVAVRGDLKLVHRHAQAQPQHALPVDPLRLDHVALQGLQRRRFAGVVDHVDGAMGCHTDLDGVLQGEGHPTYRHRGMTRDDQLVGARTAHRHGRTQHLITIEHEGEGGHGRLRKAAGVVSIGHVQVQVFLGLSQTRILLGQRHAHLLEEGGAVDDVGFLQMHEGRIGRGQVVLSIQHLLQAVQVIDQHSLGVGEQQLSLGDPGGLITHERSYGEKKGMMVRGGIGSPLVLVTG